MGRIGLKTQDQLKPYVLFTLRKEGRRERWQTEGILHS
jgi:hypothetical protein